MTNNFLPETGFVREAQIIGRRGVTEEEAAHNREQIAKAVAAGDKKAISRARNKPTRARPPLPGVVPFSRCTWWNGVRSGKYPQPVKLGPNITAWRVEDIRALIDSIA
ncbi:AlpA family transcriptional regulator [Dechloromonas sp. H13]|uniref:helix-turn-helix transcriptional regulator n=1 Tax=Dechloromonas sp. H13 TaxID=2570193 RepID=UPI00129190E5|nr:AlpA family phage regulatory protein [Dechloromonas sp. H13]